MPSDKPDKVEKWRHPVSAVQTLTATSFAQKVLENGLRVTKPVGGYFYAALETDDGYDMIRCLGGPWDNTPTEYYLGTDPAANTECSDTVPVGQRWLLEAIAYKIVCDANVADRTTVAVIMNASGGTWLRYWSFGNVTASQTATLDIYPSATTDTTGTTQSLNMGMPIELPAGTVILTTTTNRQVGDNYNAPIYTVRRQYV